MTDRMLRLALALTMIGPLTTEAFAQSEGEVPTEPQRIRIEELWEHPEDITIDDNDPGDNFGSTADDHLTTDLSGGTLLGTPSMPRGVLDNTGPGNETPRRGFDTPGGATRLIWGGYTAALTTTNSPSIDNTVRILNSEGALIAPGTLRNSILTFTQHSTAATLDGTPDGDPGFANNYNETNASYAYTLFSSSPGDASAVDVSSEGIFYIGMSNNQAAGNTPAPVPFRFLIQVSGSEWYYSNEQTTPNININADGVFNGPNSNSLTREQRIALFSQHDPATMTWTRVSPAAEANMNGFTNGGEVALGSAGPANPSLHGVTGIGVVASTLATGRTVGALPNTIAVLGIVVEGNATAGFDPNSMDVAVLEDSTMISYDILLSSPLPNPVMVDLAIGNPLAGSNDGLARPGKDFTATVDGSPFSGGTLTFNPGETQKTVTVTIIEDNIYEPDEAIGLALSNPVGSGVGDAARTITILNDDTPPVVSLSAAPEFTEGGSPAFNVELSNPTGFALDVSVATFDGTALASIVGVDRDYIAVNAVFNVNHTGGVINEDVVSFPIAPPITTIDDTLDEDRETFTVAISNPVHLPGPGPIAAPPTLNPDPALVARVATILDNDIPPTVAFSTDTQDVAENGGFLTVTLQLSGPSGRAFTAFYTTADVTANSLTDYTGVNDSVTFAPDPANPLNGEVMKQFNINISEDAIDEFNEVFQVVITGASTGSGPDFQSDPPANPDSLIGTPQTQNVAILDNDPPPTVSISATEQMVPEEDSTINVTVNLSAASGKTVVVDYVLADVTAMAPTEYNPANGMLAGTLSFPPGTVTVDFPINIFENNFFDPNPRTFTFTISNPRNTAGAVDVAPSLGTTMQTITIIEDDTAPTVVLNGSTQNVAEEAGTVSVLVSLSNPTALPTSVDWVTGGGTAVDGVDYIGSTSPSTINFSPFSTGPYAITLNIIDDKEPEPTESFNVSLSNPVNVSLGITSVQVVSIIDTDTPPVPVMIFCETWDNVSEGNVTAGPVANSDEGFVVLAGSTATPLSNLDFDDLNGSVRLQRTGFATGGSLGATSIMIGNNLRAPVSPALDDDTVCSITLQMRVFFGERTPDGTPDYPNNGDEALAPLSTLTFAIGSGSDGDLLATIPSTLYNQASLSMRVNNDRTGDMGTRPRLEFAVNDADYSLAQMLGVPAMPNTGIGAAIEGIGMAYNATGEAEFEGHEYVITTVFTKHDMATTDIHYSIEPISTGAPITTNGVQTTSISAAFPFNRLIDQAALNIGSGFGEDGGGGGPNFREGSWVDDLKVFTFGEKILPPLSARSWTLYE